jgi:hypothetical protein
VDTRPFQAPPADIFPYNWPFANSPKSTSQLPRAQGLMTAVFYTVASDPFGQDPFQFPCFLGLTLTEYSMVV